MPIFVFHFIPVAAHVLTARAVSRFVNAVQLSVQLCSFIYVFIYSFYIQYIKMRKSLRMCASRKASYVMLLWRSWRDILLFLNASVIPCLRGGASALRGPSLLLSEFKSHPPAPTTTWIVGLLTRRPALASLLHLLSRVALRRDGAFWFVYTKLTKWLAGCRWGGGAWRWRWYWCSGWVFRRLLTHLSVTELPRLLKVEYQDC